MARPPMFKALEKQRIVLSVLRGEYSVAEAARDGGHGKLPIGGH